MANSSNALIKAEMSQSFNAAAAMTDSGDNQIFTVSGGTLWSGASGYEPTVTPNGVVSGRNLVSTHASNDTLTIAACTCYLAGVLTSVSADATKTITRPASAVAKVCSVTITSSGEYAVVAGTDSATTAFSTTRGEAGGPPYVPTTSIEVAQIKVTSDTAAVIASTEIFQNGDFTERYDFPGWVENNIGDGENADSAAEKNAHIKFDTALDDRHTGDVVKGVYISWYKPAFSNLSDTYGWSPAKNSASGSSTQLYGNKVKNSVSKSLGTAGFSILLKDGITDPILSIEDTVSTFKIYSDQNKSAYSLTQGMTTIAQTFPVDNDNEGTVTIVPTVRTANFSS